MKRTGNGQVFEERFWGIYRCGRRVRGRLFVLASRDESFARSIRRGGFGHGISAAG